MSIKKGSKTIASSNQITNWGSINGNISDQEDLKNLLQIKADVNSPTFYGTPTVPTAEDGTNNLQIANTKFVQNAISKFDALPDQTNNSGKVLSTDGSNPIWVNQSSSNDGKSITLNDNGEIQASGIVNSNNPSEVVTMWIGTKDEYNALPSHSDTCIYNITDDADSVDVYTKEEVYNKSETYNKNETYSKLETYNKNETYSKSEINEISKNHLTTNQITNCITEIPQDIKLELNNGTLTLKAGSKVYVPNGKNADGSNKFDVVIIESDITSKQSLWGVYQYFPILQNSGSVLNHISLVSIKSGGTEPTPSSGTWWYDVTNNKIKRVPNGGSAWEETDASFPLAIVTSADGSTVASIDQVFNGFGYIGSTVFALPGVKGLIPNGRNEDGSLRNNLSKTNNVLTYTSTSNYSRYFSLLSNENNIFTKIDYMTDFALQTNEWKYDRLSNLWSFKNQINTSWINFSHATFQESTPYTIMSFEPTTSFNALDYNNLTPQLLQSRGIQSVIETYKNGTSWYRIWSDGWCEQGGYVNVAANSVANGTIVRFLKSFIDTNYTITMLSSHNDTSSNAVSVPYGNSYYGCYQLNSKTTETIKICGIGTWYACGYIS